MEISTIVKADSYTDFERSDIDETLGNLKADEY